MVWELGKICMKRLWQRKAAKKGGPALHTNKNFISNWFLICKLGYSRIKMGVEHIRFWKKTTGISRFVISPLEILHKTKLFIKKSCKIIWYLLGMKPNSLWILSLLPLENFSYFLFSPRKFYIVFLQYSWRIQVLE